MLKLQDKSDGDNLLSNAYRGYGVPRPPIVPAGAIPQRQKFLEHQTILGFNSIQGHVHNSVGPSPTHDMSLLVRRGTGLAARGTTHAASATAAYLVRSFSALNRPPPKYPGHVPLTFLERGALAVGSAVGSLMNPRRAGKGFCLQYKN
jgi:hypothetical protein